MRIDIADLLAGDPRILQRELHTPHSPFAFFRWSRNVVRVAVHPVPDDLPIYSNPTPDGVFTFLDHDDPCPFSQHKSITILVERTARFGRFIIPERQGLGCRESRDTQWSDRRFGATGHHDIGLTSLNQAVCIPNAMIARGASRHGTGIGPFGSDPNRHLPGGQVDNGHRNKKW